MLNILNRFAVSAVISGTATFCALSLPFLPGPAHAAVTETVSVRVAYSDLNLESRAGRLTLERRIHRAARQICGNVDIRNLRATAQSNRCMENALGTSKLRLAGLKPVKKA